MQATANAQFARYSYRRVNQVPGLIRGKPGDKALAMLPGVPRTARVQAAKTLKSAVANAGKGATAAQLKVAQARATHGPVMKRVRPTAMGGRAIYKRKTCHLTIIVSDENGKGKK